MTLASRRFTKVGSPNGQKATSRGIGEDRQVNTRKDFRRLCSIVKYDAYHEESL